MLFALCFFYGHGFNGRISEKLKDGGWMRFLKSKISERIRQPPDWMYFHFSPIWCIFKRNKEKKSMKEIDRN
jgi:hypothetical protein